MKEIYLAGGCFWGTQHFMKQIQGVTDTEVGYANGHTPHPTYQEVYTDTTGYAETVRIEYNPDVVSLKFLLELYFTTIDPTSLNRQGGDIGTRYRTGIYYTDESDLDIIRTVFGSVAAMHNERLAVEITPLRSFFPAEEYHQDYLDKNPEGYCHIPRKMIEWVRSLQEQ